MVRCHDCFGCTFPVQSHMCLTGSSSKFFPRVVLTCFWKSELSFSQIVHAHTPTHTRAPPLFEFESLSCVATLAINLRSNTGFNRSRIRLQNFRPQQKHIEVDIFWNSLIEVFSLS